VKHGPSQIFAVAKGELHDEAIGPEGARVLVGRKLQMSKAPLGRDRPKAKK
jgi:hypothetical protein